METAVFMFVKCATCGEIVPAGAYCGECGAELHSGTGCKEKVTCPVCGRDVAQAKFCSACGYRLPLRPEETGANCIVTLVKDGFFDFDEQEKTAMLFFLSKKSEEKEDCYLFKADLADIYILFEVFSNDLEDLKVSLKTFFDHSTVKLTNDRGWRYFNWISAVRVNGNTGEAEVEISKEMMQELEKIYQQKYVVTDVK